MEQKKSARANLETKRTVFLEISFIIVLALVFFAFEYKSYDKVEYITTTNVRGDITEEITPITIQKVKLPTPKVLPVSIMKIVKDDVEVIDIIEIDDMFDDGSPSDEYFYVEEPEQIPDDTPFIHVGQMPEFKGGFNAMYEFIGEIINYPRLAKEIGISGRVFLTFVVERDGSITDVQVTRGIGGGCDEEAVRVIEAMPDWNPGKQREKPVRVQFQMAIKFTLQ